MHNTEEEFRLFSSLKNYSFYFWLFLSWLELDIIVTLFILVTDSWTFIVQFCKIMDVKELHLLRMMIMLELWLLKSTQLFCMNKPFTNNTVCIGLVIYSIMGPSDSSRQKGLKNVSSPTLWIILMDNQHLFL